MVCSTFKEPVIYCSRKTVHSFFIEQTSVKCLSLLNGDNDETKIQQTKCFKEEKNKTVQNQLEK